MLDKSKIIIDDRLYLDYSATGKAYSDIEEYISKLLPYNCNLHSENSYNSQFLKKEEKKAKLRIKKALGIDNSYYVIQTGSGATSAIKKFLELIGIYIPPATLKLVQIKDSVRLPVIIIGSYEHHSNELCYREGLCELRKVKLTKDFGFDLEHLNEILIECKDRVIIGSFSAASNITGIKTPCKEISSMIKKYGGRVCFDVATSLSHENISCGIFDVLFISAHKLIGGNSSSGLLIIKKSMCNPLSKPTFSGGGTVTYVGKKDQKYITDIELREQAGTIDLYALIRASLALELRNNIGIKVIDDHENSLKDYFFSKIDEVDGLILYAKENRDRIAVFSFNIDGIYHEELAKELSYEYKIETRSGCCCAGPYGHDLLGLEDNFKCTEPPGWVRVGFNITHTKKDIDYLVDSLKSIVNSKIK